MPESHRVATLDELPDGGRKIVEVAGKSIGLFNVSGEIHAVLNICPHELAPVCRGRVSGTTLASKPGEPLRWGREGEILACPWHGWEFDLLNGDCLVDPKKRLRKYAVKVEGNLVFVEV